MKRLVLHIGSPKTGTTSIQELLVRNRDALLPRGVNYSMTGRRHIAHNGVVQVFRDGGAKGFCEALDNEISESAAGLHVVSSELFFRPAVARMITEQFDQHLSPELRQNTTVVCYLRRHDRYLEALYKQLVKNGKVAPDPEKFFQSHLKRVAYLPSLKYYAQVFGRENICVRPFERARFPQGDVVQDFATVAGFPDVSDLDLKGDGATNKSLSVEVTELIGFLGQHTSLNTRQLIRDVIANGSEGSFKGNDVYTLEDRRRIGDHFRDEDTQLRDWFSPEEATFFDRSDLDDGAERELSISQYRDNWRRAAHTIALAVGAQTESHKG